MAKQTEKGKVGKTSKNAKTTKDAASIAASKAYVKVIVPIKGKNGSYHYKEQIVHKDKVQEYLKQFSD